MKRDNSADIAISSKKQKHISNVDENILQISSNNLLNNYGSNSLNKHNFSNNNLNYSNSQNISINNFTNNILNNLSSLQNLINSPKDKKEKQNSSNNLINHNIKKLNLSNSNLNANNYLHSGPYTTTNKAYINNLINDHTDNYNQNSNYNNTNTNVNSLSNFNSNQTVCILFITYYSIINFYKLLLYNCYFF